MLLLPLLLVPMVLAAGRDRVIDNYFVRTYDDTLLNVEPTDKSSTSLDLSGLGLQDLDKNAFAGLTTLRNLSLANNSLSSIPAGLFSNLTSLEHLQLSDNNITGFSDAFVGLANLRTLDISNNRLKQLRQGELYGLPKSSVVLTKGLELRGISTWVFEKPVKRLIDPWQKFRDDAQQANKTKPNKTDDDNLDVKVCIRNDVLTLVEPLKTDETLPTGCRLIRTTASGKTLSLNNLGVSKFASGWCRLDSTSIRKLSLAKNQIVQLTRETLNDLSSNIQRVDLSQNRIDFIDRGIIVNYHIKMLRLTGIGLKAIDSDAFARTSLRELYVHGNALQDATFVRSLPSTLVNLTLQFDKFTVIPDASFANFSRLTHLCLYDTRIRELTRDTLKGLSSLLLFVWVGSDITKVPVGFFRHSPNLISLSLRNNRIAGFEKGVFDDVPNLNGVDVINNKIRSFKDVFPDGVPSKLSLLYAGNNKIEALRSGDLVSASLDFLVLDNNNISSIERGAFDLPKLMYLSLASNSLRVLDADSFQGLGRLRTLGFFGNGITEIPRHFAKHLGNLKLLHLWENPVKRLQNGALYGFKKDPNNTIDLSGANLEAIEGGLFDF